jgi:nicotinamide mononucleotide transporter
MNTRLALLTIIVSAIAIAMAIGHLASWLEAFSFVTGALCVWLTVKESVWNFPIGLINVRLFADAGLQIVYFVLGVIGWWMWLYGGENLTRLIVSRATAGELAIMIVLAAAGTFVMWRLLQPLSGAASFWDALTTSISLVSQWLLNRKRLENWMGWILVDAIYVPLYAYKHLYLTAFLYAIFLLMATMGFRAWRESLRDEKQLAVQGAV